MARNNYVAHRWRRKHRKLYNYLTYKSQAKHFIKVAKLDDLPKIVAMCKSRLSSAKKHR